jgi:hypothetical protein
MTTQTLTREDVTPFQSRLFAQPGTMQLSEISEFQAQNWRIGDGSLDFHIALAAPPLGTKIAEYFEGLGELYPQTEDAAKAFRAKPYKRGNLRKFSLAVMSIKDTTANTPLGMMSLGMELKKSTTGKPDWLLDVDLEAICTSPHRPEPAIEHMLCAGVADLLYDEMSSLNRQARDADTRGRLHIGLSYSKGFAPLQLFAGRLRVEIDTMGHLINRGEIAPEKPGLRIMPTTDL